MRLCSMGADLSLDGDVEHVGIKKTGLGVARDTVVEYGRMIRPKGMQNVDTVVLPKP